MTPGESLVNYSLGGLIRVPAGRAAPRSDTQARQGADIQQEETKGRRPGNKAVQTEHYQPETLSLSLSVRMCLQLSSCQAADISKR